MPDIKPGWRVPLTDEGREQIILAMAKGAHDAHYCQHSGNHEACSNCREAGHCFELTPPADIQKGDDWWLAGLGALEALEAKIGIKFR